ncbi:uncharacterized protein METZ01_LOCUS291964, partial [marine metagenome]
RKFMGLLLGDILNRASHPNTRMM